MATRPLTTLYEDILKSAGLLIDETGLVNRINAGGQIIPVKVLKKHLFIPTNNALRLYSDDAHIAFHPLSESMVRGQSPVLKWLRQQLIVRLQAVLGEQFEELMQIAADPAIHRTLSPKGTEFLKVLPEADAEMVEKIATILGKVDGERNKLLNIYLKQGGTIAGKAVRRGAIVTFPLINEFDNVDGRIFEVKPRSKKEAKAIQKLFNWMIPDADNVDTYSFGSSSDTAPFFHALVNGYIRIAERLNEITKTFKKQLDVDELHIDLDWASDVVDLTPYRAIIPPLAGNEGDLTNDSAVANQIQQNHPVEVPLAQPQAMVPAAPPSPIGVQTVQTPVAQPVNPYLPTIPGMPVIEPHGIDSVKPLGISGAQATKEMAKNNIPMNALTDPAAEWDRVVMARSLGYATTPPPGMPLGVNPVQYPWLANQPGTMQQMPGMVPMGAVPMGYAGVPGMMYGNGMMPTTPPGMAPGFMPNAPIQNALPQTTFGGNVNSI